MEEAVRGADSVAMAGFLGRRRELAVLRADRERAGLDTMAGRPVPRSRVLLVAGRPGSGRSALAEEFARQVGTEYPDGLLRARLTGPGSEPVPLGQTARELLGLLGVQVPAGAGEEELTETLRGELAGRRVLLLLDDVPATGAVAELIPDSRDCLVLAVAGGPLTGVPDVRPCTLGGLETPASIALLARGAGAVRITVDPRAAESLVEECGQQPAALVLVGGWLAARPDAAVNDALRLLREPPRDGLDGADEPLERAFRLALSVLAASSARVLRFLALAPGGMVDAHTAAALAGCATGAARTALEDFVTLGLLRRQEDSRTPGEPLFAVPGCLESLLARLLRTRERPAELRLARARLLERMVRRLRSCAAVTEPPGSPGHDWLERLPGSLRFEEPGSAAGWLDSRLVPLLAAARSAVAEGGLDTLVRRLLAALVRALIAHCGAKEAAPELYRVHELTLEVARRQRMGPESAAALLNLADLDVRARRSGLALNRYREAWETARGEGPQSDPHAAGRALESIGETYAGRGDWQRAADWYERALALSQTREERASEARLQGCVGWVLAQAGQWNGALRAWRAAAATHRRRGDTAAYARALAEAARVLECAGRPADCLRTSQEALRWAERAGDSRLQAALRLRLATSSRRLGREAAGAEHQAVAEQLLAAPGASDESSATTEVSAYEMQIRLRDLGRK